MPRLPRWIRDRQSSALWSPPCPRTASAMGHAARIVARLCRSGAGRPALIYVGEARRLQVVPERDHRRGPLNTFWPSAASPRASRNTAAKAGTSVTLLARPLLVKAGVSSTQGVGPSGRPAFRASDRRTPVISATGRPAVAAGRASAAHATLARVRRSRRGPPAGPAPAGPVAGTWPADSRTIQPTVRRPNPPARTRWCLVVPPRSWQGPPSRPSPWPARPR
jgi:hypothetical protein